MLSRPDVNSSPTRPDVNSSTILGYGITAQEIRELALGPSSRFKGMDIVCPNTLWDLHPPFDTTVFGQMSVRCENVNPREIQLEIRPFRLDEDETTVPKDSGRPDASHASDALLWLFSLSIKGAKMSMEKIGV